MEVQLTTLWKEGKSLFNKIKEKKERARKNFPGKAAPHLKKRGKPMHSAGGQESLKPPNAKGPTRVWKGMQKREEIRKKEGGRLWGDFILRRENLSGSFLT